MRRFLIAYLILLPAFTSCTRRQGESRPNPFGVVLKPETAKLWHEVEAVYGRSVRTERTLKLDANAAAVVTEDGTPVIRIRDFVTPTEVRIAHELLHLKMVREGFAYSIEPRFTAGSVTLENLALFHRAAEVVHNGVLHWMFYPKLRSMGLNPSEELGAQVADTFFNSDAAATATMTQRDLALNFFKASVEIDDPDITDRLAPQYVASGWREPLDAGRAMAESVVNGRPDSPGRELDVFLDCMNRLFKGTAVFSIVSERNQSRGAVQVLTVLVSVSVKQPG